MNKKTSQVSKAGINTPISDHVSSSEEEVNELFGDHNSVGRKSMSSTEKKDFKIWPIKKL